MLAPESVNIPEPVLVKATAALIIPEKSVLVLSLPVVKVLAVPVFVIVLLPCMLPTVGAKPLRSSVPSVIIKLPFAVVVAVRAAVPVDLLI